jgi:hypothetical protein
MCVVPSSYGAAGAQHIDWQCLQVILQLLELAAVSFTYTVTQVGAHEFVLQRENLQSRSFAQTCLDSSHYYRGNEATASSTEDGQQQQIMYATHDFKFFSSNHI